jgi:TolB-like protein/Tfp pilus assembly protein PilF
VTLTAPEKSIAVLPFSDLSQTKDQEYFCDGISEELLDSLAKIEGLRVVARTSAFAFKGKNVSVGEIAAKLGVQNILEGSLRRDGNRIRLTAQLINARDGFHLWSQTYERELQGVFAMQDEITSAIVEALRVKLALAPPPRATVNTDAHELYLQGLYHSNKGNEEDLRKAIGLFQQALEKDPNFSRAWTGIAEAWIWLADEYVKPLEAYPAAEAAAKKALALNPADAYARSSLAEARWVLNWDLNGAIAEVERALAIDPNCSQAHSLLAELREAQGNCPAAIAEIHTTQQLDPLSAQLTSWATGVMIRCDRLDEALALAQRTIELDPSYLYFGPPLARVYVAQGKLEEARAMYEEGARRTHRPSVGLAIAYAKLGRETEARDVLRQMVEKRKTSYVRGDSIASIYAALGEREEMFAWLEIAYNEHSSSLADIAFRREFRPFASEPRFVDLIRRMGLHPAALLNRERSE